MLFNDPWNIAIMVAVVAVAIILMWGLGTFGFGSDTGKQSNKIMRYRIYAQGFAVALIAILFYFKK